MLIDTLPHPKARYPRPAPFQFGKPVHLRDLLAQLAQRRPAVARQKRGVRP
jgi:hypothetical protein